jgi:hypothetical protein
MSSKSLNEVMSFKLKVLFPPVLKAISYNFGSSPLYLAIIGVAGRNES